MITAIIDIPFPLVKSDLFLHATSRGSFVRISMARGNMAARRLRNRIITRVNRRNDYGRLSCLSAGSFRNQGESRTGAKSSDRAIEDTARWSQIARAKVTSHCVNKDSSGAFNTRESNPRADTSLSLMSLPVSNLATLWHK